MRYYAVLVVFSACLPCIGGGKVELYMELELHVIFMVFHGIVKLDAHLVCTLLVCVYVFVLPQGTVISKVDKL